MLTMTETELLEYLTGSEQQETSSGVDELLEQAEGA